jgi:hypothetical protein
LLDRVDRTTSPIHIGNLRNAIDFIVPEFTPVLAAANGIVSYVKDDSTIGGFIKNIQILSLAVYPLFHFICTPIMVVIHGRNAVNNYHLRMVTRVADEISWKHSDNTGQSNSSRKQGNWRFQLM